MSDRFKRRLKVKSDPTDTTAQDLSVPNDAISFEFHCRVGKKEILRSIPILPLSSTDGNFIQLPHVIVIVSLCCSGPGRRPGLEFSSLCTRLQHAAGFHTR